MSNSIDLSKITSIRELLALRDSGKITGDECLRTMRTFEHISYRRDAQGEQVDVKYHPGKKSAST